MAGSSIGGNFHIEKNMNTYMLPQNGIEATDGLTITSYHCAVTMSDQESIFRILVKSTNMTNL